MIQACVNSAYDIGVCNVKLDRSFSSELRHLTMPWRNVPPTFRKEKLPNEPVSLWLCGNCFSKFDLEVTSVANLFVVTDLRRLRTSSTPLERNVHISAGCLAAREA